MRALFHTARELLYSRFQERLEVNEALNRSLVSYQANRKRPFYRWFKYKEGFSAALVDYVIHHFGLPGASVLDPFAGTGAALMGAREHGLTAVGIEVMPVGIKVMEARLAADRMNTDSFLEAVACIEKGGWKVKPINRFAFQHLPITEGAFPEATEKEINQFRTFLSTSRFSADVRELLDLACMSILESVSFTRKDGQYLRWDRRAPRDLMGKTFDKGPILSFEEALSRQLTVMKEDLTSPQLFAPDVPQSGDISVCQGSCLDLLPTIDASTFDLVITSPPYCNRYDYTRTYALELAYLGVDEKKLKDLRQALLSCTVENRSKVDQLRSQYTERGDAALFEKAMTAFEKQEALQELLSRLDELGRRKHLNNTNVPRMVRNYFVESTLVTFELARVVKRGGVVVMVNDNVQYGGEEVPVDLILSAIAESAGFSTERIWVLPRGKGNSSQQMGKHGRNELRKCVYIWRR